MCEYCQKMIGHDPACPNAQGPRVIGECLLCGDELSEDDYVYSGEKKDHICSVCADTLTVDDIPSLVTLDKLMEIAGVSEREELLAKLGYYPEV